jgi:hypothetical protein
VLTYNGNNLGLYLNGEKLELTTTDSTIKGNIKISSSTLNLGNGNFHGNISDLLIFNTSLSEDTIKTYFSTELDTTTILNDLNDTKNKMLLYYDFSTGKNIPTGTIIKDDNSKENGVDIKAFYTWIPRYKYRVWNIEKQSGQTTVSLDNETYNPYNNGIDIIFENGIASTGTITCTNKNIIPTSTATLSEVCLGKNGEYYTHPAFNLGSTELTGIWVGKYETTLSSDNNIIIKNNLINNAVNHNLSEIWTITNNMTAKDNIYNFSSDLDSHLIKNLEWGAVSYLSNSLYGLCSNGTCTQIGLNNYVSENKEYQTGCGQTSTTAETTCHSYNTKEGQTASTTGNVYGIYDMAGGTSEYVMANILDTNNKLQLGSAGTTWNNLDSKYYDTYPSLNNNVSYSQIAFNRSQLGDAIGEISLTTSTDTGAWYNSTSTFGTGSWLIRGGNLSTTSTQFSFNTSTGAANPNIGFRNVLTKK